MNQKEDFWKDWRHEQLLENIVGIVGMAFLGLFMGLQFGWKGILGTVGIAFICQDLIDKINKK